MVDWLNRVDGRVAFQSDGFALCQMHFTLASNEAGRLVAEIGALVARVSERDDVRMNWLFGGTALTERHRRVVSRRHVVQ